MMRMNSINNSNMNSGTIFSQLSTMQLPSTSTSTSPIWHSGMSPHDYELIPLPTNVRKCYGCGNDFVDKYRNHPYDIIVKHVDRCVMRKDHLTGALIYSTDFSNTYYYPSSEHIRQKNPLFAGLVCLSSSTKTSFRKIRPEYSDYLGLILYCKRLELKWSYCFKTKIRKLIIVQDCF